MKKFFYALPKGAAKGFETYAEAEEAAKRSIGTAAKSPYGGPTEYFIMESVAVAKQPVPDVEVVKITS